MADAGRAAQGPGDVPATGWWQALKGVWKERREHNLGIIAAGVAFYFFLALAPLLAATVLTYGLVVDPNEVGRHMSEIARMIPADAARLIEQQLSAIVRTASSKKGWGLALAIALAIYGTMQGASAIITALKVAYDARETRGFVRQKLVAAGVTLGAVAMVVAAIAAGWLTGSLGDAARGLGPAAALAAKILSWALAAAIASLGIACLYRYAPNRPEAKWVWVSPGSILATVGLAAVTAAFGVYAANFGNYNATYGSLGAVVVLLLWLYLSASVLLLGGELNGEIEAEGRAAGAQPVK
jgi:membrane protein